MAAEIIDGKELSKSVRASLTTRVQDLAPKLGRAPSLAVVLVGEDPASQVYVRSKSKQAAKVGIDVIDRKFPETISNVELQQELRTLSEKPELDGILLQLPLPAGLDEYQALLSIAPDKDVDGLHPFNQGLLLRGADAFRPCTPLGVMHLVDKGRQLLGLDTNLSGCQAVIAGRSILVGKPMGFLLLERHCTVTTCHSRTKDLAAECRKADILVAAVGRDELIKGDWVKPGAVVIDVGINRRDDGSLVGDVAYNEALEVAGAITPVPGGVGPMTIAMLLSNTVDSAARKLS